LIDFCRQAAVYTDIESVGMRASHDVSLEAWTDSPLQQITAVAKGIGICKEAAEDEGLVNLVRTMGVVLGHPQWAGKDNGVTRMHNTHRSEERDLLCDDMPKDIAKDPVCSAWDHANGSHHSNYILRHVRACAKVVGPTFFKTGNSIKRRIEKCKNPNELLEYLGELGCTAETMGVGI
jgi:hypothetical protein